jgi:hypothetical protein
MERRSCGQSSHWVLKLAREVLTAVANPLTRFRDKFKGKPIHTVAQPGGWRSVLEDVAQMPATTAAMHFGSFHPQLSV